MSTLAQGVEPVPPVTPPVEAQEAPSLSRLTKPPPASKQRFHKNCFKPGVACGKCGVKIAEKKSLSAWAISGPVLGKASVESAASSKDQQCN